MMARKTQSNARQNTRLESEGAEFLVLGQLLIQKIPAYKTYTNLPGYDLVATWPETNRSARIQVKSRWATDANSFPIKNFDCDFVVLVRLNRGYRYSSTVKRTLAAEDPEYYVFSVDEARALRHLTPGWSKIVYRKEEFEQYRGRWPIIRDFLENVGTQERRKAR
jgi:hypothetical protein